MKNNLIIITGIFAAMIFPVQAQVKNPDLQRELTLEKEYSPSVRDANKISQLPEIKAPEAPKSSVEFSNYTLEYDVPPAFSKLGVSNYFPDFKDSDQRGYVHLGVSTLLNIDGDAGYQILNSAEDRLNIFASHRSGNSNAGYLQEDFKDLKQKMKINDNLLGVDYLHAFEKVRLSADAQYGYSAFNDYGGKILVSPDALPLDRVNTRFRIHAGVEAVDNKEINYKVNLAYTNFGQKYQQADRVTNWTENRILADVDLHASFIGIAGAVKNYAYSLPGIYGTDSEEHGNIDYTTLTANPYLTFAGDNWDTRLGLWIDAQLGGKKTFVLAPAVQFNWRPAETFLAYLSAKGGIQDNSHYNSRYENRYLFPVYRVMDAKCPYDVTAGISFSAVPDLGINLFAGYQKIKSEHFYLLNQLVLPVYADAEVFKIGATVRYSYQDIWDINIKGVYRGWKLENYDVPFHIEDESGRNMLSLPEGAISWNKPALTITGNLGFKIPDIPFRCDVSYRLEAGRKAFDIFNGVGTVKMKDIQDVSLKGTYSLNEMLSVYAQANNLLFQKYDLWYGYPAQDFNVMLGVNVKF